jgi:hypothetical protein
MRSRGTAAEVAGEKVYAFSTLYGKTSLSKPRGGGARGIASSVALVSGWKVFQRC